MDSKNSQLLQDFIKTITTPGEYPQAPQFQSLIKIIKPLDPAIAAIAQLISTGSVKIIAPVSGHKNAAIMVMQYHESIFGEIYADKETITVFDLMALCERLGVEYPE